MRDFWDGQWEGCSAAVEVHGPKAERAASGLASVVQLLKADAEGKLQVGDSGVSPYTRMGLLDTAMALAGELQDAVESIRESLTKPR